MKVCPICKAVAFDDATVCYGCLHDFAREGDEREALPTSGVPLDAEALSEGGMHNDAEALPASEAPDGGSASSRDGSPEGEAPVDDDERARGSGTLVRATAPQHAREPLPAEFTIRFTPVFDQSGGFAWSCAVEA